MAGFSQMPTLGEFLKKATAPPYNFTKAKVIDPDLGRIIYLRRKIADADQVIDIPPGPETRRLNRNTLVGLCRKTGVLLEDFGIQGELFDFMD